MNIKLIRELVRVEVEKQLSGMTPTACPKIHALNLPTAAGSVIRAINWDGPGFVAMKSYHGEGWYGIGHDGALTESELLDSFKGGFEVLTGKTTGR